MKAVERSASAKCAAKRMAPALLPGLLPAACTQLHCHIMYTRLHQIAIPCSSLHDQ